MYVHVKYQTQTSTVKDCLADKLVRDTLEGMAHSTFWVKAGLFLAFLGSTSGSMVGGADCFCSSLSLSLPVEAHTLISTTALP